MSTDEMGKKDDNFKGEARPCAKSPKALQNVIWDVSPRQVD